MGKWPEHQNPPDDRAAKAPYNFVPLPRGVVVAHPPLDQDTYHVEGLTGWIECELTTRSPTYVRGLMTLGSYRKSGQKAPDALSVEEKLERAPFYGSPDREMEEYPAPVIPGSTLRGMIRGLVEIAGYGRMRWVARSPTFTFRAVAAPGQDPLKAPYQAMLGKYGGEVRTGYLAREGDAWYIQPARTPRSVGLGAERGSYFKVKERFISPEEIPGFVGFDDPDYHPGFYHVTFDAEVQRGEHGNYVAITRIGSPTAGPKHANEGVLVCSGNMKETKPAEPSKRKNHALLLSPDDKASTVRIPEQRIRDYRAGLTPFQKQELWGGSDGCLVDGGPVFYVARDGEALAFGHSPNFRVPALLRDGTRAATPRDFVPDATTAGHAPDLADTIFGWVKEAAEPQGERAGRVFFGDAHLLSTGADGIWFRQEPITPHVLSSPKPTTFQHYLVQDPELGHDPENKASLAHYGTRPAETQVRGHKLYWHKGSDPDIEASAEEREHESQLTRIVPLQPGVTFSSRVRFENLHREELGALLWALALPGKSGKVYCHKLGMGKPLGMGAVQIMPTLYLSDRTGEKTSRYARLFDETQGKWWLAEQKDQDMARFISAFETYVLEHMHPDERGAVEEFAQIKRIETLLKMLEFPGPNPELTKYMDLGEFEDRRVLPSPMEVLDGQRVTPPTLQRELQQEPISRDVEQPKVPTVGIAEGRGPEPPLDSLTTGPVRPGRQSGTVTYFNLVEGKGRVRVDETDLELEFRVHQIRDSRQYLPANARVYVTLVEDDSGFRIESVERMPE